MLSPRDLDDLRRARTLLESQGLAVRLTEIVGKPIEIGIGLLPARSVEVVHQVTRSALQSALRVALGTLSRPGETGSSDRLHKLATATSGAVGGLFGLAGLAVELPVTTVLMLRSIGDIARSEGHDLGKPETRMACLEVFALGGPSRADDAAETGYFAVRAGLAKALADASRYVAEKGMAREGAPVLVRLVETVAARFGFVVEEKVALGAVPVVGAVGGSLVNTVFTEHFQNKARGHFIVKRLEAAHGEAAVRAAWDRLG